MAKGIIPNLELNQEQSFSLRVIGIKFVKLTLGSTQFSLKAKLPFLKMPCKKSRLRETPNLSTDADSSTKIFFCWRHQKDWQHFFSSPHPPSLLPPLPPLSPKWIFRRKIKYKKNPPPFCRRCWPPPTLRPPKSFFFPQKENKFTPKDKIFYTDNFRASVTNCMSACTLSCILYYSALHWTQVCKLLVELYWIVNFTVFSELTVK